MTPRQRHLILTSVCAIAMIAKLHAGGAETDRQICLQRAGKIDDFFARFASTNVVECFKGSPAGLEPGAEWNVIVVESGKISFEPWTAYVKSRQTPLRAPAAARMEKAIDLDVGTIVPKLRPGEFLAFYLPNLERDAAASLRPVPRGRSSVTLPAGEIVPMIIRDGKPVRVGRPLSLQKGDQLRNGITFSPVVLAVVELERKMSAGDRARAEALPSPEPRLIDARGKVFVPLLPLAHAPYFHRSLAIFPQPAAGKFTLRLGDDGWQTETQTLTVTAGAPVTIAPSPLRIAVGSR